METAMTGLIGQELKFLLLAGLLSCGLTYDCIEKCGRDGQVTPVSPAPSDANCLITLPDNPIQQQGRIVPCQMDIQPNCTGFCHLEITFTKFNLQKCNTNSTYASSHCDRINRCEYVILQETGRDPKGGEYNVMTHFDGDLTSQRYTSRTNRVLLHFCYRSETFSGRNIQLVYRAVDPEAENSLNIGPISVYVLGGVVILLAVSICIIRWSPWVKPCLDPPPPKKRKPSASFDL